jgi:hypothetical protein
MRLLVSLLFCTTLSAQALRWSATTGDVALTATALTFTIQQPATGAKSVALETAIVYCSVDYNITQAQNGTAASATAATPVSINSPTGSVVTKFFTASNVGAGTTIPGLLHGTAGLTLPIDLSKISFPSTGIGTTNYSITIPAVTGTCNITVIGSER